MALPKAKKVELIDSYKKALSTAASVAYVSFKALPVKQTEELRRALRAENSSYFVVKKTLWDLAVKDKKVTGEAPLVQSEMAVIVSEDLLVPARLSYEFSKTHKGKLTLMGGIFDGAFKSQQEMMVIATIPPRDVLLSQLAYLLKSPMQRLAIGINEVAKTK
jgi:large subunit ribosomal protein L10